MSDVITLTPAELMQAAFVGIMRQVANLRDGRRDAYGCDPDKGWQAHCEGACGEMVVAKTLGLYWTGNLGNLRADDVGMLQVRTSAKDRLILHKKDPDDRAFVLVTGRAPTYLVQGWIFARDGKLAHYWDDPTGKDRPAFFVPREVLLSIDDLRTRRAA